MVWSGAVRSERGGQEEEEMVWSGQEEEVTRRRRSEGGVGGIIRTPLFSRRGIESLASRCPKTTSYLLSGIQKRKTSITKSQLKKTTIPLQRGAARVRRYAAVC